MNYYNTNKQNSLLANSRTYLPPKMFVELQEEILAIERLTGNKLRTSFIIFNNQVVGLNILDQILPETLYAMSNLEIFQFNNYEFEERMMKKLENWGLKKLKLINVENIQQIQSLTTEYLEIQYNRDISIEEEKSILQLIENCKDYKIYIPQYVPKLTNYQGYIHLKEATPRWKTNSNFFTREIMKLEKVAGVPLITEPKFEHPGIGNHDEKQRRAYHKNDSDKITKIGMPGANLDVFPDVLFEHPDLEYLDLSNNNFEEFPEEIFEFKSLKKLYLSNNKLTKLDNRIQELPLNTIVFSHNKIQSIPRYVGEIDSLKYVDLSYNKIKEIPVSFFLATQANYIFLEGQSITSNAIDIERIKSERSYKTIWRLDIDDDQNWHNLDGGIVINPTKGTNNRNPWQALYNN